MKGLEQILVRHTLCTADQLLDSSLGTTRYFWRKKLGYSEEVANDPRPLSECVK